MKKLPPTGDVFPGSLEEVWDVDEVNQPLALPASKAHTVILEQAPTVSPFFLIYYIVFTNTMENLGRSSTNITEAVVLQAASEDLRPHPC